MKTLKTCSNGHSFYKSSDCPVCPICEKNKSATNSFLDTLSAPARRALENEGIQTEVQLSAYSQKQILALHGLGKSSLPKLVEALEKVGLQFRV